jgi:hypothetical protein
MDGLLSVTVAWFGLASSIGADGAQTAWERYLQEPTPELARATHLAAYSNPRPVGEAPRDRLLQDLGIIEYEVAAGNKESILLIFRINAQFPNAGALSERFAEIAGRGIRSNPEAYLLAVRQNSGQCLGVNATGDFFVDRPLARAAEERARARALERVLALEVRGEKDRCLSKLLSSSP